MKSNQMHHQFTFFILCLSAYAAGFSFCGESSKSASLISRIKNINPEAIELAVRDMKKDYPEKYTGPSARGLQKKLEKKKAEILSSLEKSRSGACDQAEGFLEDVRDILLKNPLLDFNSLVVVRRKTGDKSVRQIEARQLGIAGLSTHLYIQTIRGKKKWDCDVIKIKDIHAPSDSPVETLYKAPDESYLIGDLALHHTAEKALISMGNRDDPMKIYEISLVDSSEAVRLSPDDNGGRDHFMEPLYMPDENILMMGTPIMTALPCEYGSRQLTNMYLLNREHNTFRQLGIDQESSHNPSLREDGRVMYVRYEYTDTPHYFPRIVMCMNPDGTNQREFYGSNSYWPTSVFYPRQVPGNIHKFFAVVSGHHGPSRMGKLVLFDVRNGRREADGALQFIGERRRRVEPIVVDRLYEKEYPKFLFPQPLNDKYCIAVVKLSAEARWGIYLVDVFDNMTLIREEPGSFFAYPHAFTPKKKPPLLKMRVSEKGEDATVYIQNIYKGPGLKGIPQGTVKRLRIFTYHYGFMNSAGHKKIGFEGPWDARYILGTVPVQKDGSAIFRVPAMLPISLQPLDSEGRALQLMRSWINPQPGEYVSCIGCHESMDTPPVSKATIASTMQPVEIEPWRGKPRPFAFNLEVQPVLDKHCVQCHNGEKTDKGVRLSDLSFDWSEEKLKEGLGYKNKNKDQSPCSTSYMNLQKHILRPGPESDYHLNNPMEWFADNSKLIRMLKKGHYSVKLDREAWDRLYTWIDLNLPYYPWWKPEPYMEIDQVDWRVTYLKKYANVDFNPEQEYLDLLDEFNRQRKILQQGGRKNQSSLEDTADNGNYALKENSVTGIQQIIEPEKLPRGSRSLKINLGKAPQVVYYNRLKENPARPPMNDQEVIELVRVPAGRFTMGSADGYPNERLQQVTIRESFWISKAEITNAQYSIYNSSHQSGFDDMPEKDQTFRGVPLCLPNQPVVRVSCNEAEAFCSWLSERTGLKVSLPTEEEWEWAARAGKKSPMYYGEVNDDFSRYANLSDFYRYRKHHRRNSGKYFDFVEEINDRNSVSAPVKSYQPNAWGLFDVNGNAAEWTGSDYDADSGRKTVRGGSWARMPVDATVSVRWGHEPYQRVFDVGFRVVVEEGG